MCTIANKFKQLSAARAPLIFRDSALSPSAPLSALLSSLSAIPIYAVAESDSPLSAGIKIIRSRMSEPARAIDRLTMRSHVTKAVWTFVAYRV